MNRNTLGNLHADVPANGPSTRTKDALTWEYETCIHQNPELYLITNKNILPASISLYYGHLNSYMLDRPFSYATCHMVSLKALANKKKVLIQLEKAQFL